MPIDMKQLETLMTKMQSLGIAELAYEGSGESIRLVAAAQPDVLMQQPVSLDVADVSAEPSDKPELLVINSSMHGVFYRADAPDAPPLVDVGSVVEAGAPLCILEAMKVLSKIEAEYPCRILRVLKADGDAVSPGTGLFEVERHDA